MDRNISSSFDNHANKLGTEINPYNFISTSDKVIRNRPTIGNNCGKLSCTLITKTPLCMPDEEYVQNRDITKIKDGKSTIKTIKTMPFFTIDSHPVIPGSEIRGMLRSEFEAITNSCLSVLNYNSCVPKDYNSCNNTFNVCEACALFGMIGEKGSKIKSKLRFTDAKAVEYTMIENKTLKILGGPNTQKGKNYFNYDAKNTKTIKGRKFYYHSDNNDWSDESLVDNNQTITTDLIEKESIFKFDVYFDGIDDTELKKVVWLLCLGENTEDSTHMHKLGHGKPLGLGSVKIIVDDIYIRSYDKKTYTYIVEQLKSDSAQFSEYLENEFNQKSNAYKELMAITDFNYLNNKGYSLSYNSFLPSLID